jgi:ligand-binding SRPBCC domain-containing protein
MDGHHERVVAGTMTGRLGLGDTMTLKASHFGYRWSMTSKIVEWERPHRFVDQQVSGPFARWRHEHIFATDTIGANTCVMHDVIDFTAPAGVLGRFVSALLLRPYLQRLIRNRNAFIARVSSER